MKFIDAHLHLSDPEYKMNIEKIIEDAKRSNVVALVSNSMNLQTSLQSVKLVEKYPKLAYAALGIHPWNAEKLQPNELEHTADFILNHKQRKKGIVAIGEIGLDYKYLKEKKKELLSTQYEVFCKMLHLSEKLSMPAIIHSRGTMSEIADILSSYNIKKILLHWFSGPLKLLPKIVDQGYYISEGPPTVYSGHIQDIVRRIPLNNLLTETDGPIRFFKMPFNGEMTLPSYIPLVVEAIAKLKQKTNEDVAQQIYQNLLIFFGIECHEKQ